MSWVFHFNVVASFKRHASNFHRKGYLMLQHVAGATIQVANLVNYKRHYHECKQLPFLNHDQNVNQKSVYSLTD